MGVWGRSYVFLIHYQREESQDCLVPLVLLFGNLLLTLPQCAHTLYIRCYRSARGSGERMGGSSSGERPATQGTSAPGKLAITDHGRKPEVYGL